jgi:hypothetical protein
MPNTFELIASSTVGAGGAASIDFTSIASTWTNLCIKASLRTAQSGTADPIQSLLIQFNGTTTNYSYRLLQGYNNVANSYNGTTRFFGDATNSDATASTFGNLEIYIPNYAGSTNKSYSADSVTENNGTKAAADLDAGLWSNTAAITSISLSAANNFVQYSTAYLYGVKNA